MTLRYKVRAGNNSQNASLKIKKIINRSILFTKGAYCHVFNIQN